MSIATTQSKSGYSSAKGATGPLRHSWRTVMTKDTNGSGPELIVLGRDEAGKPRAARFPTGHDGVAAKAAKAMNLAVCKADGEVLSELAKKLPPGRLYSTGRGFVPSVGPTLYGKLVEQLKLAGQPVPDDAEQPNDDPSAAAQAAAGLPRAAPP